MLWDLLILTDPCRTTALMLDLHAVFLLQVCEVKGSGAGFGGSHHFVAPRPHGFSVNIHGTNE